MKKTIDIGLYSKRQLKTLVMALFLGKAITHENDLRVSTDGAVWRIRMPDTALSWAVWYGFVAGKKMGYMFGLAPMGTKWVSVDKLHKL